MTATWHLWSGLSLRERDRLQAKRKNIIRTLALIDIILHGCTAIMQVPDQKCVPSNHSDAAIVTAKDHVMPQPRKIAATLSCIHCYHSTVQLQPLHDVSNRHVWVCENC